MHGQQPWGHRPTLLLLIGLLWQAAPCLAHNRELDQLKLQARFHAALIWAIQYTYQYKTDTGLRGTSQLVVQRDKFRLDRADRQRDDHQDLRAPNSSQLLWRSPQDAGPAYLSNAFDGRRQQFLDGDRSVLQLQDGNEGARYAMDTPQSLAYLWLAQPHTPPLRWDVIIRSDIWDERFRDARYLEKKRDDAGVLEVVEFPQRGGAGKPCICRVEFATDLGYLPVRFERRVEDGGQLSTSFEITRFEILDVDGRQMAIPLEVELRESGADQISRRQTETLLVEAPSLRINDEVLVDDNTFTLDASQAKTVYDVDEFQRLMAEVGGKRGRALIMGRSWARGAFLWVNLIALVLIATVIAMRWKR